MILNKLINFPDYLPKVKFPLLQKFSFFKFINYILNLMLFKQNLSNYLLKVFSSCSFIDGLDKLNNFL